jgi:hypothetical protein
VLGNSSRHSQPSCPAMPTAQTDGQSLGPAGRRVIKGVSHLGTPANSGANYTLTHKRFRTSLCVKLMERGGPYMARYAGDRRQIGREMRLYNDLKGHCPVRIKEFHATGTSKGRERCQRCPTGYATEMCKKCGKHLWQVRRLYTLESGKTIIGSCHRDWPWHTEEDIAQFKKLKGEKL